MCKMNVFCAMYVTVSVPLNTDLTTLVLTVLPLLVLQVFEFDSNISFNISGPKLCLNL